MRGALGILATIGLAAAGCSNGNGNGDGPGPGGGTVSCTRTGMTASGTPVTIACIEATGLTGAAAMQFQDDCPTGPLSDASTVGTQAFATGPCSRVNAAGGCLTTSAASTTTAWYYSSFGVTAADVPMICANLGATYVAP